MGHLLRFFSTARGSNRLLQDLYNVFLADKVAIYAHFLAAGFFFVGLALTDLLE
jgi:hypothetical protein